jgi:DNA-binding response OmpR family regulator
MKRILVIEDERFLAQAFQIKVTKLGYDVRIATDGVEALKILTEYTPDLIFLDLMLPRKDGFSTLEEIRKDKRWKTIPVVVISNLSQDEDYARVARLGVSDYIIKAELRMDDLANRIERAFAKQSTDHPGNPNDGS